LSCVYANHKKYPPDLWTFSGCTLPITRQHRMRCLPSSPAVYQRPVFRKDSEPPRPPSPLLPLKPVSQGTGRKSSSPAQPYPCSGTALQPADLIIRRQPTRRKTSIVEEADVFASQSRIPLNRHPPNEAAREKTSVFMEHYETSRSRRHPVDHRLGRRYAGLQLPSGKEFYLASLPADQSADGCVGGEIAPPKSPFFIESHDRALPEQYPLDRTVFREDAGLEGGASGEADDGTFFTRDVFRHGLCVMRCRDRGSYRRP
jgi:hypothetical protein